MNNPAQSPSQLRLYMLRNSQDSVACTGDAQPLYFSSKFLARETRDLFNLNLQVDEFQNQPWFISPGPDHKKSTGHKRQWNG